MLGYRRWRGEGSGGAGRGGGGELAKGGGGGERKEGGLAGLMRGGAGSKAASASGSLHYDEETGREVKSPGTDRDAKKKKVVSYLPLYCTRSQVTEFTK